MARADHFEKTDPFEAIPPALLSSAEINDYAEATGMLCPFYRDQLKPASYQAHIGGDVIWWDDTGHKRRQSVKRGDVVTLPANSIVFVQVEPTFRLPYYIAIRFNLRITHVHRGLLLGTGPLVDPGFRGKLLIPLHNLTTSDYKLDTNEALIWIEFTKTSYNFDKSKDAGERFNVEFPAKKRHQSADEYLLKANDGNAIRSSISDAIADARRSARSAKRGVTLLTSIGILAIIGLIIGLYQIYLQIGSMTQSAQSLVSSVQQSIMPISSDAKLATEKTVITQTQLDRLSQQVENLSRELESLKKARGSRVQ